MVVPAVTDMGWTWDGGLDKDTLLAWFVRQNVNFLVLDSDYSYLAHNHIELGILAMLTFNIFQAVYALRFPPSPRPPLRTSPSKTSKSPISSPSALPFKPNPNKVLTPYSPRT